MAAVLDAMVPYVKKLITDMAEEEVSMLLGVSGEIEKLEDNIEGIKAFLADAERRRLTDQSVQRWVRKLKDAMYDATDIIDECHLEAADKRRGSTEDGSSVKKKGCFQPLLFCIRNPVFAHKIGSRIKELNQRLDGIHKEADRFKFSINLGSNPEPRKLTDAERSTQNMTSEFDESAIVGEKIEQDTRELAQLLITGGLHDIKVVSIVGTGGMGKTTLAQKIFNEVTIQDHFKVKVWLSITQHFNEIELLKTAIEHAGGVHGGTQDKTHLTRTLTKTLSTGRFLLVLDDVWCNQAWSHVLSVPVKNASQKQQGNWVLITTRSEDLAQRMGTSFYQHRVSPLNEEDAWSLLTKQLPPSPNPVVGTDYLRDVGMKIVKKCDGLPLAVKVMGGLLSMRSRSEREWEAVLNHHAWSVTGLPKELDSRIYLSYEDLSPQQKQCFLYCSLFPKGTSISWLKVIPMWISEGFIQPHADKSSSHDDQLEEIATEYYKELITRNLLEPQAPLTAYHCTMHDVVRSFAEFMAREESLVVEDMQVVRGSNDSLVRRLSIGPTSLVPGLAALQKKGSVRTLFINSKMDFELSDSLNSFSMLRVLSIHGGDCDRLVGSLCQLRHLRYLGLEGTNISRLPDNINNMKFLQHIVLTGSVHLENLPRTIIQLVHLRTLDIFGSNDNVVIPKEFGMLRNLRILGFRVRMDMDGGWCSLEEIGPLSKLIRLSLHGLEDVSASSLAEMARISSKEHLEYLALYWSSGCMELRDEIEKQQQQQVVEEVLEKLCPPPRIHHLYIKGYFGRTLPNWMMVVEACAFKSLSILSLQDLPCCTKLPDGLCRIPSLKSLVIEDAPAIKSVGSEFQASSSSSTASTSFPNLTHLSMEGLCEWEEWEWEEQTVDVTAGAMAMHALEFLKIHKCKLSCLPPGLANNKRHALRGLYLYELSNLASVENFPSVVKLDVFDCPKLKRISGLSKLHKIRIVRCPELEVFQGVPVLDIIVLVDATMETLPGYLACVNPRFLKLGCSKELHDSIISGSSSECEKISHITKLDINCIERRFR
ncbi:hypothetical protein SETIT_8G249100v2 [Setaria italica]|uniref:AAA+ ATPase domain-containing protein n=1 Tax=Setaria italica TaxID=4555 RepID=K3ZH17_SETIT|nr:putative disease resistance protein RGA3 isoform X2 [Setaria italica]XP_022685103.1 putative disease resistance protein RGA3 isoform X2 [Setaria italica]XP_022685104.1 putative disease resistance protein RGA3 isoform X2 [Setaria italica]XP_022685105.1 putative disease resistance protein RGA3 isoform X2 [Setaria italica]XP_022685106.1 putative disease resistance protein RGA3 isoform X2 [Setaria italica]RCV39767.1 hypothetical protein SETIT_8G249100v2 [Setaria italica]